MFTRGSRYEGIADAVMARRGRDVRYKRIRFLPSPPSQGGYVVAEGDRPDLAAHAIAQDPESWWRLADANRVDRPVALTDEAGERIAIPDASGAGS